MHFHLTIKIYMVTANQVAHVNCGNCRMLLMYQYGARSVKCAVCNFVTSVGVSMNFLVNHMDDPDAHFSLKLDWHVSHVHHPQNTMSWQLIMSHWFASLTLGINMFTTVRILSTDWIDYVTLLCFSDSRQPQAHSQPKMPVLPNAPWPTQTEKTSPFNFRFFFLSLVFFI